MTDVGGREAETEVERLRESLNQANQIIADLLAERASGSAAVDLTERDLSALRFAATFVRGFEKDLEERHPDDPNPVTGTREGEATSDVLAAIVARAERSSGPAAQNQEERLQRAIDVAYGAMDASAYVGGPSEREAWQTALTALGQVVTQHMGQDPPTFEDVSDELEKAQARARAVRESGSAAQNHEDIRDEAVRNVDARHGFTMEFAPSPEAHREEYDREEERLRAARSPQDEDHEAGRPPQD